MRKLKSSISMRRIIPFLLCAFVIITIISSTNITFALETDNFVDMTTEQQYEHLQTLSSEEEIQHALSMLSAEQITALEEYKRSVETEKTEVPVAVPPAAGSLVGFTDMTAEEQYEYLQTLNSEEEIQQALSMLSAEQITALEEYKRSVETDKTEEPVAVPPAADSSVGFTDMTPKEQYEYLQTLNSEEETQQALSILSAEQIAALEEYKRSVETDKTEVPVAVPPAAGSLVGFTDMTPEEQYKYLQTLECEEEIQQALDLLSSEQLAAFEEYKRFLETNQTDAPTEAPPVADDPNCFAEMPPEEQYEYLIGLESEDEITAALDMLTDDQYTALQAYALSLEPKSESVERPVPAVNYTKAGPLKKPVLIPEPKVAIMGARMGMMSDPPPDEEDLITTKTVSPGTDSDHLLTIEAYATGEVSVTTIEEAVPADIILVLDTSGSMAWDINADLISVHFNRNTDAYNYEKDIYVIDDGKPCLVIVDYERVDRTRVYTYSYTATDGTVVTATSNRGNGTPPDWDFYEYTTTSRLAALKTAAKNFIESVEAKANEGVGVDHRIAVVEFASDSWIISGTQTSSGAFVPAYNNASGINTLTGTINGLSALGATRADLGMGDAVDIFNDDPPSIPGLRNRAVVFFTDGSPTTSSDFSDMVANSAISHAKTLKNSYGATVYSIGIFDGADPAAPINSSSTLEIDKQNSFMHFVSSNYPNATSLTSYGTGGNDGYYLSASNTGALNDIFETISQDISTGGTSVTLDETAVLKDIVTPYFVKAGDVRLYTADLQSISGSVYNWAPRVAYNQPPGVVNIDGQTIRISGFDYSDNYCAAIENNGTVTGYRGKKLIIEIPIDYVPGSCFGGTVPTNEGESGIYQESDLVEALPIPCVDIPVVYDFTSVNNSIYLTQSSTINDLFTEAPGYVPDGVNNAFVDIVYTVIGPGSTTLATYTIPAGQSSGSWDTSNLDITGLTENTPYTINCTVTPVSGPVSQGTFLRTATVFVWKPVVTYMDSTIYLGETADYNDNFVDADWQNSSGSAPTPTPPAPALSYVYSPTAVAFSTDTHVSVQVNVDGQNITSHTTFMHNDCSPPSCGFDPNHGQFMVHVKTCSLTIIKTGAADPTDTFVFEIVGTNGISLSVSIQGNGSRTVVGLPVGSYTVTEDTNWSWRYTALSQSAVLSSSNPSKDVTISNSLTNNQWLSGDSWCANLFAQLAH